VASWSVLQRKKEEGRRKEEEVVNLAEIHLNFEKLKVWSKWW
jgi:hypothetical protein